LTTEDFDESDWTRKIYMPADFKEAAKIVKAFEPFGDEPWPKENASQRALEMIDPEALAKPTYVMNILANVLRKLNNIYERVSQFPRDDRRWKKELLREMARSILAPRNIKWIRENGMCLEHLVPKKSTLPDAGLGGDSEDEACGLPAESPAPASKAALNTGMYISCCVRSLTSTFAV